MKDRSRYNLAPADIMARVLVSRFGLITFNGHR